MLLQMIIDVPTVGGRLMLVDMTGSENIEQAGQTGMEAKMQTAKINQGNSALKRVVESIANGDSHVPFRDNKLTMLLQDSFEDNKSKILMILCASPDPKELHKTISTLEYGGKAKYIVRGPYMSLKEKGEEDSSLAVILGSRIAAMDQFIHKLQMENKLKEKPLFSLYLTSLLLSLPNLSFPWLSALIGGAPPPRPPYPIAFPPPSICAANAYSGDTRSTTASCRSSSPRRQRLIQRYQIYHCLLPFILAAPPTPTTAIPDLPLPPVVRPCPAANAYYGDARSTTASCHSSLPLPAPHHQPLSLHHYLTLRFPLSGDEPASQRRFRHSTFQSWFLSELVIALVSPSRSLQECSSMVIQLSEEKAQAEAEIEMLKKNMSVRSAEVANKQHLEGVKKIAKLEAERRRLRGLVWKKLLGPTALAQMKLDLTTQTTHVELRPQLQSQKKGMNLADNKDKSKHAEPSSSKAKLIDEPS
ncbi:Filament-like plant protein 4 [Capsicum baccatum]|uniref:Filament-like plant protein 4 n=1 Tax=Capsicum baccatum TaxID=33114 RepID=A0A2G2V6A7_CAPBA|nr:Filament-like plant protein 4 [Capsicum baccatum]